MRNRWRKVAEDAWCAPTWKAAAADRKKPGEQAANNANGKEADDADDKKRTKQADVLIALSEEATLFHTSDHEGYADIITSGHRETHRVRGQAFKQWLRHEYFKQTRSGVNSDAMQIAIETIAAKASFEGEEHQVHIRVAQHAGDIYVDVGDASWCGVKVTAEGWEVVEQPPVRFQRSPGTRALPIPERGGSIEVLKSFCNIASEADFVLLVAFALAVLRPNSNYAVLVLTGEQGSCKSTTIRFIVWLTDPRVPEQRSLPRDEDDLITAAKGAHLLPYDNVSGLKDWLSDAFCRLATGGGTGKRKLYSDDDEVLFAGRSPISLNGIEDLIGRADLLDRCVMLTHQPIPENRRRDERELESAFKAAAPKIMGALFDGISSGLKHLADIKITNKPRMADFALWAEACTRAYWKEGTFLEAYRANLDASVELVLESSPVGEAVRLFMARKTEWTGTSSDLLSLLTALIGEQAAKEQNWPRRANLFSGKLRRAAPALRKTGVHITFERGGHASTRTIKIVARSKSELSRKSSSAPSALPATEQKFSGPDDLGAGDEDDMPTMANEVQTMAADTTVCTNSLEDNDGDDTDAADDDLRSFTANRNVPSANEAIQEGLRAGDEPKSARCPMPPTAVISVAASATISPCA